MRISDWSSDVCSSDLAEEFALAGRHARSLPAGGGARMVALVDMGKAMPEYFAARVGPAAQAAGELRIACQKPDRQSVVEGQSVSVQVDLGGRRILKKQTTTAQQQGH